MVSETTIRELKQILKEEYRREIDLKEVSEIAHMLVGYFDLLTKIHNQEKLRDNYDDEKSRNQN
jgi:hypothetical protein